MDNRTFSCSLGLSILLLLWMAVGSGCSKRATSRDAGAGDENHDGLPSIHKVVIVDPNKDRTERITPSTPPADTTPRATEDDISETARDTATKAEGEGIKKAPPPETPEFEALSEGKVKPNAVEFEGRAATEKEAQAMRRTLMDMTRGLKSGDKALLVSAFDAGPEDKVLLEMLFDSMIVMQDFEADMKKTYGEDAMKNVDIKMSQKGLDMSTLEEWKEDIRFKVQGDKAVATVKGQTVPMNLVKKGDKWLIVMEQQPIEDKDREMFVQMMKSMMEVVNSARAKIGKEGYTAKKIGDEMKLDMMGAMFRGMLKGQEPAR